MNTQRREKASFTVIGKEGSTEDGIDFIQKLWKNADSHFNEVVDLAQKNDSGKLVGLWGAMSDYTHTFQPWTNNFTRGLYLAGVECSDGAKPPEGWTKWIIPGYEYITVEQENDHTFQDGLAYLHDHSLTLAGAVHDHTDPETGKAYMYFPIRRL